jgi:hypothetical protein
VGEYAICPAVERPVLHFAYPIVSAENPFKGVVAVSLDLGRYALFPMDKLPQGSALSLPPELPQSKNECKWIK